jgi:hypothetical protein
MELVNLLKSHAGLPNTRNWEQKISDKCMVLINTSARAWEQDGLLVNNDICLRKSDVFQYLWESAIQAAQMTYAAAQSIEQAFQSDESGKTTGSVNIDLMTGTTIAGQDSYSRKVLVSSPMNMR